MTLLNIQAVFLNLASELRARSIITISGWTVVVGAIESLDEHIHTLCNPYFSQWTRSNPLRILLRRDRSKNMDYISDSPS
jgi:hypothetical protein